MTTNKIESPASKAWKRLKKNYLAILSLGVIVLSIIIALFAPAIAADSTPNANDQVLEIANESPGFKIDMLLIRKNRKEKKTGTLKRIFIGQENLYKMVPILNYNFDSTQIIAEVYRGKELPSEQEEFDLVEVLYPLSITDQTVINDNGTKLIFKNINEEQKSARIDDMRERVEEKAIGKRKYLLGTDNYGRDILSRLLFGLRVSISVGFVAVFISLFIGIFLGAIAGFYRNQFEIQLSVLKIPLLVIFVFFLIFFLINIKISISSIQSYVRLIVIIGLGIFVFYNARLRLKLPLDDIIMWFINVVWSIPTILLAMALSFSLGNFIDGFWVIYIAVGLSMWVEVARIVRGQVLSVREMEYVQAARSLGFNTKRTIFLHILPNIVGPIMVITAANFAAAILIEAGLSFIGIGVQPPKPSWGTMLSEYRNYLTVPGKAFLALSPGIAIMILVLAFNLLGNGLRDAFDVKGKEI